MCNIMNSWWNGFADTTVANASSAKTKEAVVRPVSGIPHASRYANVGYCHKLHLFLQNIVNDPVTHRILDSKRSLQFPQS